MYIAAIILSVIAPVAIGFVGVLLLDKIRQKLLSRVLQFSFCALSVSLPPLVFVFFRLLPPEAALYCILLAGFVFLLALFANGGHFSESITSTMIVAVLAPNVAVFVHSAAKNRQNHQQSGEIFQEKRNEQGAEPEWRNSRN